MDNATQQNEGNKMNEKKEIKVGDIVNFKHDVEQSGPVVEIEWDKWNQSYRYWVLAKEGDYINDKINGTRVALGLEDLY